MPQEESTLRMYFAVLILLLIGSSQAANITVCPDGCNYSSIQAAVTAANSGDTIEAHSGFYNEDVVLNKDVALRGNDTGGGKPSIGVMHLCGHPESMVVGFTFGFLNVGYPAYGEFKMPKDIPGPGTKPMTTSSNNIGPSYASSSYASPSYTSPSRSSYEEAGKLLYLNDFSSSLPIVAPQDYKKEYTVACKAGRVHITVLKDAYVAAVALPKGTLFGDFTLGVEATQESGPDDGDYGVIIRQVDDNNYYRFRITGDGSYGFDKLQNGNWIELVPMNKSDAIHAGKAMNLIKVDCNGDRFTFSVNGVKLGEVTDNSFAYGGIGLEVGTHSAGNVHISFDNMKVWKLSS